MIHLFVTGGSLAYDVSVIDRERFVPSSVRNLYEAKFLDCDMAITENVIERAGLVRAEIDPADGLTNIRTLGGLFAGCIGKTDTIAELETHYAAPDFLEAVGQS